MFGVHGSLLSYNLLSFVTSVVSYSFQFDNNPEQCGDVSISIVDGAGTPPYRLSIIPWGSTPLPNGLEVRHIMDIPFNDTNNIKFTLPYPQNSQFVAAVSDHNGTDAGFGSGGVTVPVNVLQGASDSCIQMSLVHPSFTFSLDPDGVVTTCQTGLVNWDNTQSQGTVKFWGIVNGGQAFVIQGQQTTDGSKPAIPWTPLIKSGTNVIVVGGDDRGFGSGGSFQGSVQPGNGTTTCLSSQSFASTPGSPAGGSYPTNGSGGRTQTQSSGHSNVGAIVGGVVGGVVGIAIIGLVVFLLLRRRNRKNRYKETPVDLLDGRPGQDIGDGAPGHIPEQYIPEPFHIPESTSHEMSEMSEAGPRPLSARDRRISGLSMTTQTQPPSEGSSGAPWRSTTTGKSAAGPSLRPVNIIQHEDAGQAADRTEEDETQTVELPPAYTNIRK